MIDEHSIKSNDIYAILTTYGVEAARATILDEIGGVFKVYKIDVDARHLELIADYMVRQLASLVLENSAIDSPIRHSMAVTDHSTGQASPPTPPLSSKHPSRRQQPSSPTPLCMATLTISDPLPGISWQAGSI